MEYDKTKPILIFTEKVWLLGRKNNLCSFTDEELKAAENHPMGLIKVGHVPGIGIVNMILDRYLYTEGKK